MMTDTDLAFERVFDFSGKTVLVTGAANGIGLSIAQLFAERGARLALFDKSPQVVEVAGNFGAEARGLELDIVDDAAVARAVASVVIDFGRIDVLINNAGIGGVFPAESTAIADWRRIVDVNLSGQ